MPLMQTIARRIGFGFRPEENIPNTVGDWLEEQLTFDAQYKGVATAGPNSKVSQWPEELKLDVKEIYKRVFEYNRLYDKYTSQKGKYTIQELLSLRRDWIHANEVFWQDETRIFHSAIYGEEQVRQRLIHFWANHFTVGDGAHERKFIAHHIEDAIGGNLKGNFKELLFQATISPGMVHYLDNNFNIGENSAAAREEKNKFPASKRRQIGLNDNLARELLELHTITPKAGYTEADIRECARILAGWGLDDGDRGHARKSLLSYELPLVRFFQEPGDKTVFGKTFKAGPDGLRDLTDLLADHPSTAEHLSYKLCQHFVADEPNKEDVKEVHDVWQKTRGHLPDVHMKVMQIASNSNIPKFQWPMTWFLQTMRMAGASLIDGWDEVRPSRNRANDFVSQPRKLSEELGQGFYLRRQPNGYSQVKKDWISPAHLERRVRFASLIAKHGQILIGPNDLATRCRVSQNTRDVMNQAEDKDNKFIILACSQDFMEA